MRHFLVFGSHPALSLAEYCAIRPDSPKPVVCGDAAVLDDSDWDGAVLMNLLGGTVKLGDVAGEVLLNQISAESVAELLQDRLGEKAIDFGWTAFGGSPTERKKMDRLALPFKKELKARGISSRWVTGKNGDEISPAAVAKLKLTTEGLDVCLLIHENKVSIGFTTAVQDADAWSLRDYGRPGRSSRAGMLPPKLARIMVNLAHIPTNGTVADPFCGSGTILMEAALASKARFIIGSDNEAKQIADTDKNNAWLLRERVLRPDDGDRLKTFLADARELSKHVAPKSIDRIVTEGYLGPPLTGTEKIDVLKKNTEHITKLWIDSLENWRPLLKPHAKIVAIWPGFLTEHGHSFVNLEDKLANLGYELLAAKPPLVYKRPDQHVSRRIVVLRPLA